MDERRASVDDFYRTRDVRAALHVRERLACVAVYSVDERAFERALTA